MDWIIIEHTGWTYEYLHSLSIEQYNDILQVMDGRAKGMKK